MKKEKKFTVEKEYIEATAYMTQYVREYAAKPDNSARYLGERTVHNECEYYTEYSLDYGDFTALLTFDPYEMTAPAALDITYRYAGCSYDFGIHDIFNLYEINDFSKYFHHDVSTNGEIRIGVNNLLEMTEKYRFDIARAKDELAKLSLLYEADREALYGADWRKLDKEEIKYDSHPSFIFDDGEDSAALLKRLDKAMNKGKLHDLYARRLYAYLNNGNTVDYGVNTEQEKFNKKFRRSYKTVAVSIGAISVLTAVAIAVIGGLCFFHGAYVPIMHIQIKGVSLPLPYYNLMFVAGGALFLYLFIYTLFGKRLFKKINRDDEERGEEKFDKFLLDYLGKNKVLRVGGAVLSLILGLALAFCSGAFNIGFYDDHIKYQCEENLMIYSADNEDINVYRLDGFYDRDGDYCAYEGSAYALSDGKGHSYELGILLEGGETEKRVQALINGYNKPVRNAKTIGDIEE